MQILAHAKTIYTRPSSFRAYRGPGYEAIVVLASYSTQALSARTEGLGTRLEVLDLLARGRSGVSNVENG